MLTTYNREQNKQYFQERFGDVPTGQTLFLEDIGLCLKVEDNRAIRIPGGPVTWVSDSTTVTMVEADLHWHRVTK